MWFRWISRVVAAFSRPRRYAPLHGAAASPFANTGYLPANKNVKWALSLGLWDHFRPALFTEILDVMRDTGFIGLRLTGFPRCFERFDMPPSRMEKEVSKRNLYICTISFNAPSNDASQVSKIISDARRAMTFLKMFGAKELVVFSPSRLPDNV